MPALREIVAIRGQYHIYNGSTVKRVGSARWGGAWTPELLLALQIPVDEGTSDENWSATPLSDQALRILVPKNKNVSDYRLLVAFQCHRKGTTMYKGAIQHLKKGHVVLLSSFAGLSSPDGGAWTASTEPGHVTLMADMVAFPFFWSALKAYLTPTLTPTLVVSEIEPSWVDVRACLSGMDAAMELVRRR